MDRCAAAPRDPRRRNIFAVTAVPRQWRSEAPGTTRPERVTSDDVQTSRLAGKFLTNPVAVPSPLTCARLPTAQGSTRSALSGAGGRACPAHDPWGGHVAQRAGSASICVRQRPADQGCDLFRVVLRADTNVGAAGREGQRSCFSGGSGAERSGEQCPPGACDDLDRPEQDQCSVTDRLNTAQTACSWRYSP